MASSKVRQLKGHMEETGKGGMPSERWANVHSTNALHRLNRELKRRTRVVSIFPTRAGLEQLAGALLLEEHEE
jgi:transposase-like protein